MTVKMRGLLFVSVALALLALALVVFPSSAQGGSLDEVVYSEGRGSVSHCDIEYEVSFFESFIAPYIDADHECSFGSTSSAVEEVVDSVTVEVVEVSDDVEDVPVSAQQNSDTVTCHPGHGPIIGFEDLAPCGATDEGLIRQPDTVKDYSDIPGATPAPRNAIDTSRRATTSLAACKAALEPKRSEVDVGAPFEEDVVLTTGLNGGPEVWTYTYQERLRTYTAPSRESVWVNGELVSSCTYDTVEEVYFYRTGPVCTQSEQPWSQSCERNRS